MRSPRRRATKVLVTAATGRHVRLLEIALPGYIRFAQVHGYELVVGDCSEADGRPAAWAKVRMLRRLLDSHEEALWVDCDATIIRANIDPFDEVPAHCYQALVQHTRPDIAAPNTGVWLLRSCNRAKEFLDAVWAREDLVAHHWWEQAAVASLLGFMIDDDLGAEPGKSPWSDGFGWLDPRWNTLFDQSHPHLPSTDEIIRHHTGMLISRRIGWMRMDTAFADGHNIEAVLRYCQCRSYYGLRDYIHRIPRRTYPMLNFENLA